MTHDLEHGGSIDAMRHRFPNAPNPWVDLSTGINPWPFPYTDLRLPTLHHLPTKTAYQDCRDGFATAIGAPKEATLLAPGSELIIRLLPTILPIHSVAVLSPTYGDHAAVWYCAGCHVIETGDPLSYADQVDAVVLCNPNNPDGRVFSRMELLKSLQVLAARNAWLIIDEAYADLAPETSLAVDGGTDGLIVLRSTGKFFGLPGLRLGAFIAPATLRTEMSNRLGVWPISGPALEIGQRAYRDVHWQSATRRRLAEGRLRLDHILSKSGLKVVGGTDLFAYVDAGNAHDLWQHLGESGIYVRRFSHTDQYLRLGLPPNEMAEDRLHGALTPSK